MINADLAQSLWDEATDDVSIDGVGRTTIYHRFALAVERELLNNMQCSSETRCVELDELHADAAYLFHRVKQGSLSPDDAAASLRAKIDAAIAKGASK